MNPNIEQILDHIGPDRVESIVRSVLNNQAASVTSGPNWQEINAVHNDRRTLAIVRCSGTADLGGNTTDWSCVVKIIDHSLEANVAAAWVNLDVEEQVYELGLMTSLGVPFRPAQCFGVDRTRDGINMIWLEDMSAAPEPPWTLDQYIRVARHIGEFNGQMALNPPDLPFELPVDVHRTRRDIGNDSERTASFYENRSHPLIKTALNGVPPESVVELFELWGQLHDVTPSLPHGIAFGDCHARNLFPLEDETVAVDWAGMAMEPIGADISVLIGSGLSWGIEEAVMVVENEPTIFESYLTGLRNAGWAGELDDVRRAFFTHFPLYLSFSAILPEMIRDGRVEQRREFVEARFGAALEELPERMPPITARIPGYVEELRQLLE